jgi:hypothetical protein
MDGRLFLAYPHDSGALSQSFDELNLMDDGSSDLVSVQLLLRPFEASLRGTQVGQGRAARVDVVACCVWLQ